MIIFNFFCFFLLNFWKFLKIKIYFSDRSRSEYAKSREIKLTITCVKLSLAFVVCWMPFVILRPVSENLKSRKSTLLLNFETDVNPP